MQGVSWDHLSGFWRAAAAAGGELWTVCLVKCRSAFVCWWKGDQLLVKWSICWPQDRTILVNRPLLRLISSRAHQRVRLQWMGVLCWITLPDVKCISSLGTSWLDRPENRLVLILSLKTFSFWCYSCFCRLKIHVNTILILRQIVPCCETCKTLSPPYAILSICTFMSLCDDLSPFCLRYFLHSSGDGFPIFPALKEVNLFYWI